SIFASGTCRAMSVMAGSMWTRSPREEVRTMRMRVGIGLLRGRMPFFRQQRMVTRGLIQPMGCHRISRDQLLQLSQCARPIVFRQTLQQNLQTGLQLIERQALLTSLHDAGMFCRLGIAADQQLFV